MGEHQAVYTQPPSDDYDYLTHSTSSLNPIPNIPAQNTAKRTHHHASSSSASSVTVDVESQRRAPRSSSLPRPHRVAADWHTSVQHDTLPTIPEHSQVLLPMYVDDDDASSSSSDETDALESALLHGSYSRRSSLRGASPWWANTPTRRKRKASSWLRTAKRIVFCCIPKTLLAITFVLVFLTVFALCLAKLIIYLKNPDKQPLPWRGYCTIPIQTTEPPPLGMDPYASFPINPPKNFTPISFPPNNLDTLSPAGIFIGVFSMDSGFERRSLIRSTYASHPRSRNGAGEGDGGTGTSRTIIRFIMGRPRKSLEHRVLLEMQSYNDIIILPIKENMNNGKTYAFYRWASTEAWVPPLYSDSFTSVPLNLSYTDRVRDAPLLATHDPIQARRDQLTSSPKPWVRPDFIIKADDDSFVMLAELEARLRVQLHSAPLTGRYYTPPPQLIAPPATPNSPAAYHAPNNDPLIYWGYTVKNRFMAGELYALSHSLVEWVAKNKNVGEHVMGAEDQITGRWMRWHPQASDIRWISERCWIYDHPKAGTVYSRGFLFPSEAKRVQKEIMSDLARWDRALSAPPSQHQNRSDLADYVNAFGPHGDTPANWVLSSVATFQVRYTPPVHGLTVEQSMEALVEGSDMSMLTEYNKTTVERAWLAREGRTTRYQGKRVGGTIVIHSIKKNEWFLETANALLEGEEYTPTERLRLPSTPDTPSWHPHSMNANANSVFRVDFPPEL